MASSPLSPALPSAPGGDHSVEVPLPCRRPVPAVRPGALLALAAAAMLTLLLAPAAGAHLTAAALSPAQWLATAAGAVLVGSAAPAAWPPPALAASRPFLMASQPSSRSKPPVLESASRSAPTPAAPSALPSGGSGYAAAGLTIAALGLAALAKQSQSDGKAANQQLVAGENVPFFGGYNPETSKQYFKKRPLMVAARLIRGLSLTGGLIVGIALDRRLGRVERKEARRARAAREAAVQLGPTFIKLGQALSIRPDLIPEAYSSELRQLQDAVPPFDSATARTIIARELGVAVEKLETLFIDMSPDPVASASIGQVYKATLNDGRQVAIKVQRPNVGEVIALDLYIVRTLAPLYKALTKTQTDLVGLVDEWGRGFIDELDYCREARNATIFRAAMAERGLAAVTSPEVLYPLSTVRVLTTLWANGTRLDQSRTADVPRLCGVALNAYLAMLLDTGTLHCDPHPGNLLRMDDGRLCILDWGMTTSVPPNLQYALLEYIAHLIGEDYEQLPTDWVNLGFLVPEKEEEIRRSGTLAPLTYMLRQLAAGGGPKKVRERIFEEYRLKYPGKTDEELRVEMRAEMKARMDEERKRQGVDVGSITYKVEELQAQNRSAFRIPAYFLYISRAFATLEGIGLQTDENYSILKECYPYLARRLLSDNSPRAQAALRSLLYGSKGLDVKTLRDVASGFARYTKSTASAAGGTDQAALWQGAEILLSPQGNAMQRILVEEAAAALSGFAKGLLAAGVQPTQQLSGALGPLGTPLLVPTQLLAKLSHKTVTEEASLTLVAGLLQTQGANQTGRIPLPDPASLRRLPDAEDLRRLQTLQSGATVLTARFVKEVLQRMEDNVQQAIYDAKEPMPVIAHGVAQAALNAVKATKAGVDRAIPASTPPS